MNNKENHNEKGVYVRVRGRLGEIVPPSENHGKWIFELWLTIQGELPSETNSIGTFGPFDTREEADAKMKEATRDALHAMEEKVGKAIRVLEIPTMPFLPLVTHE
jgi:hypothetical protein